MGWDFCSAWTKQADVKNYLLGSFTEKVLAHKTTAYGRRLWVAVEAADGTRNIVLALLDKEAGSGWWGFKTMDESMGPYYWDCPTSLLDLMGEPRNEDARQWRAEVRRRAAAGKRTLDVGTEFKHSNGTIYRITEVLPRGAYRVVDGLGNAYKLPKSHVAHIEVL